MQHEIFRLVNGAPLVGAERTRSRSGSGGNKRFIAEARDSSGLPLDTGDAKGILFW